MPCDLLHLHTVEIKYNGPSLRDRKAAVDIVAIHGLNENMTGAWTDDATGKLWLRDFLPEAIPIARVLTFGYDASATSFYRAGCADTIQRHAHTLVASLQADRSIEGCESRPIIFVCHGLGGILVKKALAYSQSRTSALVVHLNTIFVSTFGILFFGTPHNCADLESWLSLESIQTSDPENNAADHYNALLSKNSETLATITDQFAPLMKQFHVFFFWEEIETVFGSRSCFIVEEMSAAPILDNTERSGIDATHSGMVKFSKISSSSYRTIIAALKRYCSEAPRIIARRWEMAQAALAKTRYNEAFELAGVTLDNQLDEKSPSENGTPKLPRHRYFFPPKQTTSHFIGREDTFEILRSAFYQPRDALSTGHRRFVVYGMGGCGKTQFCSKFARDNQERYVAIFTIHAASMETAKESFAQIGKLGGLGETETAGKFWLSELEDPWLLIIDNADNPDLDLESLFPESDWGHILITTRNPDFRCYGTARTDDSVELKGLKKDEALQLLLKEADVPRPWDASTEAAGNEITRTLGYLALALIQAGTSIYRKICDLKDYLQFHNDYRSKRRARPPSSASPDKEDRVYAAFDFSMTYLQTKNTNVSQDAVELLNILGFYHFEHIRVDIFTRAVENRLKTLLEPANSSLSSKLSNVISTRLQPPPALPQFLRDDVETLQPYRVRRALHELYSLSLISYDGKDASFSLHPLTHSWARDRLSTSEKALWAQIALNTLAESILLPPEDVGENHGQFRKDLLPHLDACLAACPITICDYHTRFGQFQLLSAKFFRQTLLLIIRNQALNAAKCGYVYAERGRFEEATIYLSKVKNALVQVVGYENEKTMKAMLGLAGTLWGLGRLDEAITLQKRVVEARSKVFGLKHRETLLAMDQLGRSYWLHGQYHEALNIQQVTTDQMKETLGADHNDTLAALDNLGVTLGSWHKYEESMIIHEQVLLVREKRLGATDLETLTTMNNLAMALLSLNRPLEAKAIMRKVFDQRKVQLGKEHPWTLWALCNLAKINTELGLLREAEFMLVDGIAAGKRSLSESHLGVLMGCGELARVYARQGRFDEAEEVTVDMIQKLEKARGIEHPDTVYAMWKLAHIYERQDEVHKAVQACEVALVRAKARLTSQHPYYEQINTQLSLLRNQAHQSSPRDARRGQNNPSKRNESHTVRHFKRSQRTW